MVISDPTIDPVTGLPILDTSGIVQQIPLGRQTVDYAGWNATAQPTRTPLYPDDVIPVFANVQGQHPQTGNAQNVTTDGSNALDVHVVNPSTGGSVSPTKQKIVYTGEADMHNLSTGSSSFVFATLNPPATAITGYNLNFEANPPDKDSDGIWYIYIYAVDNSGNPIGLERALYRRLDNSFSNVDYPWRMSLHIDKTFDVPWDINAMWPNWKHIFLEGTVFTFPAEGNGWIEYY